MESRILVVDDNPIYGPQLASLLKKEACVLSFAPDGTSGIQCAAAKRPDLILLDVIMPGMDGFETCMRLKACEQTKDIPVIFMTACSTIEEKLKGFECGAIDYFTKPIDLNEVQARITCHLRQQRAERELKNRNEALSAREKYLDHVVREQTKAIEEHALKVKHLGMALINALENVNTLNDTDTGSHIERIGAYSAFLAEQYGCARNFVQRIRLYAPLHDVGKVGLPDTLLKKPGKYTKEERIQMQQHVVFGAKLLDCPDIDAMAGNIALYHHERWDGTGYVHGLTGEKIPLEARIVAVADVYDALVNKRVYKKAFTEEQAERLIHTEAGGHFDPALVEIFWQHRQELRAIRKSLMNQ